MHACFRDDRGNNGRCSDLLSYDAHAAGSMAELWRTTSPGGMADMQEDMVAKERNHGGCY